ncbi:unnamed protein product [Mytilus edulis]|uniref:Uncharacterized protein n=1 Tax=Mytilus edulis TaxID=6550 RepID=A0A8S3R2G8_MYTED|nr:unnamed protein product [Mytilus edulis]
MYLKPSNIHYSQDSISNTFGKSTVHSNKYIGETLDDLINRTINVKDIPTISVFIHNNKWFTTDNRRLWVFRKAEELGILHSIPVYQNLCIVSSKLTTTNGGLNVRVRRNNPGGQTWRRLSMRQVRNQLQNNTYTSNRVNMCERNIPSLTNTSIKSSPSSYTTVNHPVSGLVTKSEKPQQSYSRPSTFIKDNSYHERKKSPDYDQIRDDRKKEESSTWRVLLSVATIGALAFFLLKR